MRVSPGPGAPARGVGLPLLLLALLGGSLAARPASGRGSSAGPENVLVILADDVGIDAVGAYGAHVDPGPTPVIDDMARRGVLFRNVWANPKCAPSRATLLTGLYCFRTGVVDVNLSEVEHPGLRPEEITIPELLGPTWSSAAIGKWHLATGAQSLLHPAESGFGYFSGTFYNLRNNPTPGDYFVWEKTLNFTEPRGLLADTRLVHRYVTTDQVNEAIAAVSRLPRPWFVYLAFHAPHQPLHDPPAHLHSYDLVEGDPELRFKRYKAMKEAMDTEMGRLLRAVPPDTTVVFLGDNGTPGEVSSAPFRPRHAKGTVYDGGIHVPMIVTGPRVTQPGSECEALVNTTDLFATVAEIADVESSSPDSVSFLPYLADPAQPTLRRTIYAELFAPIGFGPYDKFERAIRDERFKLIRRYEDRGSSRGITDELYDLLVDPFEETDLLLGVLTPNEQRAYDRLSVRMENLHPTPGMGPATALGDPDATEPSRWDG